MQCRKLKQIHTNGGRCLYSGQLGRAQSYYTVADKPIMEKCFREDLMPILLEKLEHKRPGLENRPQAAGQQRLDQYLLRARGGERDR